MAASSVKSQFFPLLDRPEDILGIHEVERDETLNQIVTNLYRPRSNDEMQEFLEAVKFNNPHIRDRNIIHSGELIFIPPPSNSCHYQLPGAEVYEMSGTWKGLSGGAKSFIKKHWTVLDSLASANTIGTNIEQTLAHSHRPLAAVPPQIVTGIAEVVKQRSTLVMEAIVRRSKDAEPMIISFYQDLKIEKMIFITVARNRFFKFADTFRKWAKISEIAKFGKKLVYLDAAIETAEAIAAAAENNSLREGVIREFEGMGKVLGSVVGTNLAGRLVCAPVITLTAAGGTTVLVGVGACFGSIFYGEKYFRIGGSALGNRAGSLLFKGIDFLLYDEVHRQSVHGVSP